MKVLLELGGCMFCLHLPNAKEKTWRAEYLKAVIKKTTSIYFEDSREQAKILVHFCLNMNLKLIIVT